MAVRTVAAALCVFLVHVTGGLEIPLLVRRQRSIALLTLETSANNVTSSVTVASDIDESFPVLISVHVAKNLVAYMENWSRASSDSVQLVSLYKNGSSPAVIQRNSGVGEEDVVTSLAIDWVTGKLYVAVETASVHTTGRVEVCPLEGSAPCAIALFSSYDYPISRVDALHSLVLDPVDGYMYWLNRLYKRIERSWLDGRHHDQFPFKDDTANVIATSALTLDQSTRSLYYARTRVSPDDSQIWSCTLYERESCRVVASNVKAFYLDVFDEFLIWTSLVSQESGVRICEKGRCSETMREVSDARGVEALRVSHPRVQPPRKSPNPCEESNGGCSHICVLIPGAPWFSCLCPPGVRLLDDDATCFPNGMNEVLFIGTTFGVIYISLDTKDHTPLPLMHSEIDSQDVKVMDVDYDPVEKKIYYVDGSGGAIRTCNFDGSQLEDVVTDGISSKTEALVVDWLNRNIYWMDTSTAQIKMQSFVGGFRHTVISNGLTQPRGFAVDAHNGFMYFSDWHETANRIERAWLDGSHRETLISLEKEMWPNAIAVDVENGRIYWAEGRRSLIGSASLRDGSDAIIFANISNKLGHPYSLTKLGNILYCNSLYGRIILAFRLPSRNESARSTDVRIFTDSVIYGQTGIRAVNLNVVPHGSSPCQINKGGCSHICIKLPDGSRGCLCPVGYELRSDNATCIMPPAFLVYTQSFVNSGIMRISLERSPSNNQRINIASITASPTSIDVDQSRQRIFWVSEVRGRSTRSTLRSAFFNGSGVETVMEGGSMAYISVDWITGNIYWCNAEQRRIEMARKDGMVRRTIVWEEVNPQHLAVHPTKRFFLFVNFFRSQNIAIHKSPLEGERSGGPVLIDNVDPVTSLAIDFESDLIVYSYFNEPKGGISVVDFNGGNRATLIGKERFMPRSLAIFHRRIYFANAETETIDTFDGVSMSTLHTNISSVSDLAVAHREVPRGWNECAKNNAECAHLCAPTLGAFRNATVKCLCEDHFTLDISSKKCLPPKQFVLVASRGRFVRFKLKRLSDGNFSWKEEAHAVLSVSNVGAPSSVGFDEFSQNRTIYWIDSLDDKVIKRASDQAQSTTYAISLAHSSGCAILFALAVDSWGRQLFVSCAEHGLNHASSIHVWRIKDDDSLIYIGVVVSGRTLLSVTGRPPLPRRIALFPRLNLLFYVDGGVEADTGVDPDGRFPVIVNCSLDGRQCKLWESSNLLPSVKIYANQENERLYYTTANGLWSRDAHVYTDVYHHVKASPADFDMVPISDQRMIVIVKGEIFIDDQLLEIAYDRPTVSLEELKFDSVSKTSIRRVLALTVVGDGGADVDYLLNNTCATSQCHHLCRVPRDSRKRRECLCLPGFNLNSPSGTYCEAEMTCTSWQFKCDDGQQCVHYSAKCDGRRDCRDGSDELSRYCRNVAVDSWPCDDGKASIARALICNGVSDCVDGSDELHCRCPSPGLQFDCGEVLSSVGGLNPCISRELLCNSVNNCRSGKDEEKQLCAGVSIHSVGGSWLSPEMLVPLAVFFLLCLLISACCCHIARRSLSPAAAPAALPLNASAEARVLLPARPDGTQVEFQFRTYSVAASSSLYNALPPPNSQISSFETNYPRSVLSGRSASSSAVLPPGASGSCKFYAPPPSAASLSTYGVVKPAGMNLRAKNRQVGTSSRRVRRRAWARNHASIDSLTPPPSYSQVVTSGRAVVVDVAQDCSEEDGRRAPTNSRILSSVDSSSPQEGGPRRPSQRAYSSSSSDISLQ